MMDNIRKGWISCILLPAIVFKSLALGTFLMLSVHGLCTDGTTDNNFNWRKLIREHRKRNDEPPFAIAANSGKAIVSERIVYGTIPASFGKRQVLHASGFDITWKTIWEIYLYARYVPEQIFLHHCSLLR